MKKLSGSSVRGGRIERKRNAIKRSKIDYSDILPLSAIDSSQSCVELGGHPWEMRQESSLRFGSTLKYCSG
jgi:hypothetical protein